MTTTAANNLTSVMETTVTSFLETTESEEDRQARSWDDATWILTSSFIIFTMQSGFGLLESGSVSSKNEVNIMAKNVADVIFGGISYWMLGYGFSFGDGSGTNGFCGIGKFFIDPDDAVMGQEFSRFVFQASFATTATTIVSGAIAERTKYLAYIIFSFFNTFVFCFPAHWVWSPHGWLNKLGVVDVAGDGPVHLVGGATSLVAAIMIKPRAKRFTPEDDHEMGSPTGALLGLFILWWGWLAFNCGSTYGISEGKWKMAARAAATTLMAASAGGVVGFATTYLVNKKKFYIPFIINGVLGGLVSITATCAVTGVWESLVIGAVGALLVLLTDALLIKLHIDDPVSAIPVHGVGGVWGLIAAGFFTHKDTVARQFSERHGLVKGGSFYLLGVQTLAVVAIIAWSALTSGLILKAIDLTLGLRLTAEEEKLGSDLVEHNIRPPETDLSQTQKSNDVNDNDRQFVNRSFNSARIIAAWGETRDNATVYTVDSGLALRTDSSGMIELPTSPEAEDGDVNNLNSNNNDSRNTIISKGNYLNPVIIRQGSGNNKQRGKKTDSRTKLKNRQNKSRSSDVQLTDIRRKSSMTNIPTNVCMLSYNSISDMGPVSTD